MKISVSWCVYLRDEFEFVGLVNSYLVNDNNL